MRDNGATHTALVWWPNGELHGRAVYCVLLSLILEFSMLCRNDDHGHTEKALFGSRVSAQKS